MLDKLKQKAYELGIAEKVIFTLKLEHNKAIPILSQSKALLVNTVKDNNMISIVESIAVGTPIVTTDVPLNASYIKEFELGIAKPSWDEQDLFKIVYDNDIYVFNCLIESRKELAMELAIIIPIYNTHKEKLERCFESVNAIRSESYECILVDDGSDQETSEYLNKYSERNSNFRYIRKENGGVSSARNVGIERALEEYICFAER